MDRNSDKAVIRQRLLDLRNRMSAADRTACSARICATVLDLLIAQGVTGIFTYVALSDEVDTRALIDRAVRQGIEVAVPRIVSRTEMRAVSFPGWRDMRPGPLGILAPQSDVATTGVIDLAVVPGLGFTRNGARIGFGAGYYDRWLGQYPAVTKVGVAFECQIAASLPQEPHDIVLDRIVTERG